MLEKDDESGDKTIGKVNDLDFIRKRWNWAQMVRLGGVWYVTYLAVRKYPPHTTPTPFPPIKSIKRLPCFLVEHQSLFLFSYFNNCYIPNLT